MRSWNIGLVAALWIGSLSMVARGADSKDIVDTAIQAGSFKTLVAAVQAAGLVETLRGPGPFTVFAPTDEAFAKLPEGTVESLLKPENKDQLVAILKYHVVAGRVTAAQVVKLKAAPTVNGQRVAISTSEGVRVDNANVVTTDIATSNGVIHVIDAVLLPTFETIPAVADKAGTFKTLLAAVGAAGLAETLSGPGPFTVFAPTDEAFAKLPAGTVESLLKPENKSKLIDILKDHVVAGRVYSPEALKAGHAKTLRGSKLEIRANGKGAFVNDAQLVTTDIQAGNGVIHVIDRVILIPAAKTQAAVAPAAHHVAQAHTVQVTHQAASSCQSGRSSRRWRR